MGGRGGCRRGTENKEWGFGRQTESREGMDVEKWTERKEVNKQKGRGCGRGTGSKGGTTWKMDRKQERNYMEDGQEGVGWKMDRKVADEDGQEGEYVEDG